MKPLACCTFRAQHLGPSDSLTQPTTRTSYDEPAATSVTYYRLSAFMISPHPDDLPHPSLFEEPVEALPAPQPAAPIAPKSVVDVAPVYADVPIVKPTPRYTRHHYRAVLDFHHTTGLDELRLKHQQSKDQGPVDNTPFSIEWIATVFVTLIFGSEGREFNAFTIDLCVTLFATQITKEIVEDLKLTNTEVVIAVHCVEHLAQRGFNHFIEDIMEEEVSFLCQFFRQMVMMGVTMARPDDDSLALLAFHSDVRLDKLRENKELAKETLADEISALDVPGTFPKLVDDLLWKLADCERKYGGGPYLEMSAATAIWELSNGRSTGGRP